MAQRQVFCAVCGHDRGESFIHLPLQERDIWLCQPHARQLEGQQIPANLDELSRCFGGVGIERRAPDDRRQHNSPLPSPLERRHHGRRVRDEHPA